MCSSCSSVSYWMERPINLSEEKCTLVTITLVVLTVIGMGALSYFYGRFSVAYNQGYAYFSWAVAGAILFGAATAYIARAIISGRKQQAQVDRAMEKYRTHVATFFPWGTEHLTKSSMQFMDSTGFVKLTEWEPHFTDGCNTIRALAQDNFPFVAICVSIEGRKERECLLVKCDGYGVWQMYGSTAFKGHIERYIQDGSFNAVLCREWFSDILKGKERHLLEFDEDDGLSEDQSGPKVALWQD